MNELEQARINRINEDELRAVEEKEYVLKYYHPIHSQLLVEMYHDLQTDLELTDDVRQRSLVGSVMAVIIKVGPSAGRGIRFSHTFGTETVFREGDKVLLRRYGGTAIPGYKGKYQLLADDQVIGLYTGEK